MTNVYGYYIWHTNILAPASVYDIPLAYCNYFSKLTPQAQWASTSGIISFGINNTTNPNTFIRFSLGETSSDNLAGFKEWLSSNNTEVYYVLATPTNTEITYQPLIDQLNELEKAQSKDNQTNISQVNNNLPFIINATALMKNSD